VADTAAAIAKTTGRCVLGEKVDVTQEADVKALFDPRMKEFGRVDIVVANAAILIAEPIGDADAEKWRAGDEREFVRLLSRDQARLPHHEGQQGGSIININSKSGKKGSAANSAYARQQVRRHRPYSERGLGDGPVQCPLQRHLSRQPPGLAVVDASGEGFVRAVFSAPEKSRARRISKTSARPTRTRCP